MKPLHATTILLRLGPDARIVSPTTLRDDCTTYIATALARYSD